MATEFCSQVVIFEHDSITGVLVGCCLWGRDEATPDNRAQDHGSENGHDSMQIPGESLVGQGCMGLAVRSDCSVVTRMKRLL